MKTITIIAAATAMTVAAAPAFAQPEGEFGNAKVRYEEKTDRYCFREVQPSTLVPRVDCRSKQDWADAGLTISRKPAVQLAQR
ncbi:hypothetical protein N5J77_21595 [Sphingobium yanoikuyae]|uniref:Uncharacterized protein n=1 Tax=Sphingobium yanoikuyae TaxID=13690 RepID=A0AA42WXQ8_SPHYA|nr:hypothetical protein [Sphingobium yanoikuyae]MDH2133733.1 hypothetical protein [Sphingobium yanoikuyae]MDH2151626.1 hypothetical protein [Sphingobium yanoikuyae]MDH2169092.1 hypothetical protein [Sphingobium yanoikuyae]